MKEKQRKPSSFQFFDKPSHVFSQVLHGFQSFLITFNTAFSQSNPYIPVRRAWYDHLVYEEEVVYGVEVFFYYFDLEGGLKLIARQI
jgi:hypothetical protein